MIRSRRILLSATLLAALPAIPARADSLGQAIADAYRNNPRLEAQRAQLRAVDEGVIQASAPYRLNAGITGSLTYANRDVQRFIFGFPQGFENVTDKTFGIAVTASQILSNGGRTAAQVSAAEADVLSTRERLREVENFILLEVVDAYVSVRRDADIVAIQQDTVGSYERQVDQAQARERGGDLTRTDIAQAQAQLLIVRTQLAQARANLEQSRARFITVVGRPPELLDPEPALPGLPISIDAAYKIAEQESPTLWQAILNERGARARVSAERAEGNPTISIEGRYGVNNDINYRTSGLGKAFSGLVSVNVPLIQQGLVASRVRAAIATRQQAQFLIEDSRRTVDQALLNAWNQSVTARDQITSGEAAVTSAENALRGVRRGFSEGFRSNFEVLDSEQRLLQARLIVANARYAQYSGQANMLAYMGRLQAAAVDVAVPVYDAAENLRRQQRKQIAPFGPIAVPLDKLQMPSTRSPDAPVLAPATDTTVAPAQTPPPSGALATSYPADPSGRPPAGTGEAPR